MTLPGDLENTSPTVAVTAGTDLATEGGTLGRDAWLRIRRDPRAIIGFVLVAVFVLVAIFAPLLAPYGPTDFPGRGQVTPTTIPGPSSRHWFGLDNLGRDEFSRILYGARQSLLVGVVSLAIGMSVGCLLGLIAGAFGGRVDAVMMRLVDVLLSVPGLLFAVAVAAALGPRLTSVMIAVAVVNVPIFARLLRSSMIVARESDFAMAATSLGLRRDRVILRHVLPNAISPVIVQGTLTLSTAIIDAAGLAFLGLSGGDPGTPEWGRMLTETQRFLASAPQLAIFPGVAIMLSALGFTLLGESLREALDPRQRR